MNNENLNYGFVLITNGEHKGKIGLYDADGWRKCVVYFEDGSKIYVEKEHLIQVHELKTYPVVGYNPSVSMIESLV
jgi:hypothetical protein